MMIYGSYKKKCVIVLGLALLGSALWANESEVTNLIKTLPRGPILSLNLEDAQSYQLELQFPAGMIVTLNRDQLDYGLSRRDLILLDGKLEYYKSEVIEELLKGNSETAIHYNIYVGNTVAGGILATAGGLGIAVSIILYLTETLATILIPNREYSLGLPILFGTSLGVSIFSLILTYDGNKEYDKAVDKYISIQGSTNYQ